ncbi:MAG: hypothetical protein AB1558_09935 [Thermodesulfobacteriota bacterium]
MSHSALRTLLSFVAALCVPFTGLPVHAAPPDNFTAVMVTAGMEMPMARMGSRSRVENPAMAGLVTITLADAKKTIMLNSASKAYLEQPIQDPEGAPDIHDTDMVVERKKAGSETIDGHPCIRYDAVMYRKSRPEERFKAVIWEAQDLKGFVIQTEIATPANPRYPGSGGTIVVKFREIKLGAATASMFEVPKEYRKVGSMPELMGLGGFGNIEEMMKRIPRGPRP